MPRDAAVSLPYFISKLPKNATIGSLTGRYFGMDRDRRWDRTQKAYDAIALGQADFHENLPDQEQLHHMLFVCDPIGDPYPYQNSVRLGYQWWRFWVIWK